MTASTNLEAATGADRESSAVAERAVAEVETAAALLAAVADPVRLTLIHRLAEDGTRCVCDLQPDPPIPANLLSYHLRILREAGLVTGSRRGRWIDYTLVPGALDRLRDALPGAPR